MTKPYLIMHRRGEFSPGAITDNQCNKCGVETYHYRLTMAFDNSVKLNEMGFVVDSLELTTQIADCNPTGSCEEMHQTICCLITKFFTEKDLPILAYKCSITDGEGFDPRKPWFEHVYLDCELSKEQKIIALTPLLT